MNLERLKKQLFHRIPQLIDFFRANYDLSISEQAMRSALENLVEREMEELFEDLDAILFDPQYRLHQRLHQDLTNNSLFNGYRTFSLQKLGAMVVFIITLTGIRLSKTKLNKLAFYSDFKHFSKFGRSISGCAYRHLPHGPVIDDYENLLRLLCQKQIISVETDQTKFGKASFISTLDERLIDHLTESEREILAEVVSVYGRLNAAELSDKSHEELAYKNTRTGELIAYGYSQFLKE